MKNGKIIENNLLKKHTNELPATLKGKILCKSNKVTLKKYPLLGIIIPTKGNVGLLLQCLQSFIDNEDYPNLYIYIGDTGSSLEEKEEIKKILKDLSTPNKVY